MLATASARARAALRRAADSPLDPAGALRAEAAELDTIAMELSLADSIGSGRLRAIGRSLRRVAGELEPEPATWTIAGDGWSDGGRPYTDEEVTR